MHVIMCFLHSLPQAQEQHKQLIGQLQNLLLGPQSSPQTCLEVLEYFFDKLTLSHLTPRNLAIKVSFVYRPFSLWYIMIAFNPLDM